jgi:superfamily I DNA/RNA helicase
MPTNEEKLTKKFLDIPSEWRDASDSMNVLDLKNRLTEVVKSLEENQQNWDEDQDVQEKKEALGSAEQGYKEVRNMERLKLKYLVRLLKDRAD